jgi:hypothetical protein
VIAVAAIASLLACVAMLRAHRLRTRRGKFTLAELVAYATGRSA